MIGIRLVFSLILAALLGCPCAQAAPSKPLPDQASVAAKKSRTLKEMIDLAMREGKDASLSPALAKKMGFEHVEMPKKQIRYKMSVCPDHKEHAFSVIIKKGPNGEIEPVALDISVGIGKKVGEKIYVDGVSYLASVDGVLKQAMKTQGYTGEMVPETLPINSKSVVKQFNEEIQFHLKRSRESNLKFAR